MTDISKNTQEDNHGEELLQLVSFKLGDEEFGVDILKVQEINRLMEITQVPESPPFIEGVVNLRGNVIPVVSLRTKFHLPKREDDKDSRIIVLEVNGNTIGFTVDAVEEVLRIPTNTIEPAPELVGNVQKKYISGIAKLENRLLIFLDLNKVLTIEEIETLNQAA